MLGATSGEQSFIRGGTLNRAHAFIMALKKRLNRADVTYLHRARNALEQVVFRVRAT